MKIKKTATKSLCLLSTSQILRKQFLKKRDKSNFKKVKITPWNKNLRFCSTLEDSFNLSISLKAWWKNQQPFSVTKSKRIRVRKISNFWIIPQTLGQKGYSISKSKRFTMRRMKILLRVNLKKNKIIVKYFLDKLNPVT